jgi:hypothetical protein
MLYVKTESNGQNMIIFSLFKISYMENLCNFEVYIF